MTTGDRPQPDRPKPNRKKPIPPRVRNDPQRGWTLVPPPCAMELEADLEDAEMLLKEGDPESARDAVLYLLEECQDLIAGHELLGRIAEREPADLAIAQGHYGYVFELALKWLGPLAAAPMDASKKINRTTLACAEGLCRVLDKRGQKAKAAQVMQQIACWKGESRGRPSSAGTGGYPRPGGSSRPASPKAGPGKRRPWTNRPKPGGQPGQGDQA